MNNQRLTTLKTVLWTIVGVLATVTAARFLFGLGATTALHDAAPWGFWIAFDVMAGVALAAGGFVMAATVYIFGRKKYIGFARPAILTALLGYAAVAVGLMYDLGLPWHIWHPIIFPQPHSVLFEVAACVMLYLSVLFMEFGPVILEHPLFDRPVLKRIHAFLKKIAIPLVIAGIVLSTLHQSSLGSLFLIAPYRLHALWYSPYIWVLFFVSAIGLGLMMVTAESFFSAWLFGHKLDMQRLAGLGRAASFVLWVYTAARLGDLMARGVLTKSFDGSWQGNLFWFEIAFSALVPAILLSIRAIRTRPVGLALGSAMTILGMIGYRFNVCIVAFERPEGMAYFPSWMEVAVSLGIVALAMLVFIFFAEKLRVYPDEHPAKKPPRTSQQPEIQFDPAGMSNLMPPSHAIPRRYSLAAVGAAALAIAFLPLETLFGRQLLEVPVEQTTTMDAWRLKHPDRPGHELHLLKDGSQLPAQAERLSVLIIDGNRNGRLVMFPHDRHAGTLGQEDSCVLCHHQNLPYDTNSSCYQCHRHMYTPTDTFDHAFHVEKLGGNQGCTDCHSDSRQVKTRDTALTCGECHASMLAPGSFIQPAKEGLSGYATGYMDAMHGLCINCHQEKRQADLAQFGEHFDSCINCHRDVTFKQLKQMEPYPHSPSRN